MAIEKVVESKCTQTTEFFLLPEKPFKQSLNKSIDDWLINDEITKEL